VASRTYSVYALVLVLAAASLYWVPGLRATGGAFPAPLDDVYIHFDFARAAARGHPFEWIAGQGYSSGETSPLYAAVLAAGWAVGFRGGALGWFAALVAVLSLWGAVRALRRSLREAPIALSYALPPLLFACGVVAWSLFSGMELALFAYVLVRAVLAVRGAEESSPLFRSRRQWQVGLWGALLVWTRPEAAVIVAPLAVVVARASGARSPWAALLRAALPGAAATGLVLGLNAIFTGETQSAGAVLKLLSSNPYLSDVDRARELALNLGYFQWKVLQGSLAARPWLFAVFPGLAAVGLAGRRTRDRTAALLAAAVLYALLVSWNGAARYQNFRYYVPAVLLLLLATAHGLATLSVTRARALAAPLAALLTVGALLRAPSQVRFFRDAAANIHGQQVEAGRRLARLVAPSERILVGDAGAIAYVSDRGAVDALGLGGFRRLPFARAATFGEAATVELLQRLSPAERPAWLALYPNWFAGITANFGREVDRVTITNNVICGGPTKGLYTADWSTLDVEEAPGGLVLDEVDVADVLSEAAHGYVSPAPKGGWVTMSLRMTSQETRMFDAGRIVPPGEAERLTITAKEGATLVLRSDDVVDAELVAGGAAVSLRAPAAVGHFTYARARLPAGATTIELRALGAPLRDFHLWVVQAP
jgi:hypothetical protein